MCARSETVRSTDDDDVSDMTQLQAGVSQLYIVPQDNSLLRLPVELRNRIYEHCVEDHPIPVASHHGEYHWNSAGNFGALAKTCRQIRQEFLPLYLQNTTQKLQNSESTNFIAKFYPYAEEDVVAGYRGKFEIPLSQPDSDELRVDITDVLRLAARSPKVNCRFQIDKYAPNDARYMLPLHVAQLNNLLVCIRDTSQPKWREMVDEAILGAEFRICVANTKLGFLMSSDMAEKWKVDIYQWWAEIGKPLQAIQEVIIHRYDVTDEKILNCPEADRGHIGCECEALFIAASWQSKFRHHSERTYSERTS
ncbi:hypothetical protein NX059_012093 [Plenodomus lindquistii]|nr:hypothetical protein NX059_012093 [Plenodomus lindquistii]